TCNPGWQGVDCSVGALTVSGEINDAAGLPLPGVTVLLAGPVQGTQTTDASGRYTFTKVQPGSYTVQPKLTGCSFLPAVARLDNLASDAAVFFGGSGPSCGGSPTVGAGATDGPLAISGRLHDSSGKAIAGGRVDLG